MPSPVRHINYGSKTTLWCLSSTETFINREKTNTFKEIKPSHCPSETLYKRANTIACLRKGPKNMLKNSPLSVETIKVLGVVSLPPPPFSNAPYPSLSWSCQFRPNKCIAGEEEKGKSEERVRKQRVHNENYTEWRTLKTKMMWNTKCRHSKL